MVYADVVRSDIDEIVSRCRECQSIDPPSSFYSDGSCDVSGTWMYDRWFKGTVTHIISDVRDAVNGIPRHISDIRYIVEPKISVQNENEWKQLSELNYDSDTCDLRS
ncbi:hypothetical protein GJ496_001016 [Pomphorhynchus laevis]|nr:hypothetical protein GJ496_001016 [Pomphorhynchus laevis]